MRLFLILLFALNLAAAPALAVGAAGTPPAKTTVATTAADDAAAELRLSRMREALAGFAVASIAVLIFAARSEVLRDSVPQDFPGAPSAVPPIPPIKIVRPFSLAQTQMTWWFWIVFAAFTYLAILNRDVGGGLNEQALVLMGIGAGTAIGSALIDQAKTDQGPVLTAYMDAWAQLLTPGAPVKFPAPAAVLLASAKTLQSDGFLADVLSDANGVSLHRFQSFAWTAVLGAIFLYNVFADGKSMPTLSPYELSLLGISAGTYLGLKIPEKNT